MIFDSGDTGDVGSGYTIANSLRLRASASAYLSRTPASAGSQTTWTWAGWVKRGAFGDTAIFGCTTSGTDYFQILWNADSLYVVNRPSGGAVGRRQTTAVFRDPSAWYSVVVAWDTSNATAADRLRLYVNGVRHTSFSTSVDPALNEASRLNIAGPHALGTNPLGPQYFDGYLSDVYFIDGQALDPTSFGQFNSDNVWVPKAYSGTYGTNGFYLKFNDGSNLTNLCLDRSGNGNNWTATNVSLTAGATYDWMVDTPTNNYCVLNNIGGDTNATVANANLRASGGTGVGNSRYGTVGVSSGKWYWEHTVTTVGSNGQMAGISSDPLQTTGLTGARGYYYDGNKYTNATPSAYGATFTSGDVIGVAFDADAGTLEFFKNNTSQGVAFTGLGGSTWFPLARVGTTATAPVADFNFGQRPFQYTPPTGFGPLNTSRMPAVTVTNGRKNFDVLTWAGNNTAGRNITGLQFQPDLSWAKNRTAANNNMLFDSVRTAGKLLISDLTNAESTTTGGINAFNADGIQIGYDGSAIINQTSNNYVSWNWKAGGAAVTNTAGTITSQVSANTAAGFSIVTYTGTGANATVGHGLGVAPAMYIVKQRGATGDWFVYHKNAAATPQNGGLFLNLTNAFTTNTYWNNTSPTSSTISVGVAGGLNANGVTQVAYCFAEVPGFSKFGSYTGNGSVDGPFVFTGGQGGFLMIKSATIGGAGYDWIILDSARDPINPANNDLMADLSQAEGTANVYDVDWLANGFKVRSTYGTLNGSGQTYIYAWFSRNPFGGSNVAPVTAR